MHACGGKDTKKFKKSWRDYTSSKTSSVVGYTLSGCPSYMFVLHVILLSVAYILANMQQQGLLNAASEPVEK